MSPCYSGYYSFCTINLLTLLPHPIMRTTQEVAHQLVAFCRQGQFIEAQQELYAEDAVSLQPANALFEAHLQGRASIIAREKRLKQAVPVRAVEVTDAVVAGNHFSLAMTLEITLPGPEIRLRSEIGVYEVQNGQIVLEQFFF